MDVPRPLKDDEYPTEDYGITRIYIPAGLQRMDGKTALQYARSRHADSDFGRTHRQQQVLVAARHEALRLNMLPKLPAMIGTLTDAIYTDFPIQALPSFAMLMKDIDANNITSVTIEGDMVVDVYGDGTMFLPKREEIKKAIDSMFARTAPTPTSTVAYGPATISVHNGTERGGLASAMAEALRERGYKIADVGNDTRSDHEVTLIISYRGKDDPVARELAELLNVSKENVRTSASGDGGADILIILGADAELPSEE